MKTLAALKRAMEAGKKLKIVDHSRKELIGTERTITDTQGNGYWFTQPNDPPGSPKWWAEFPKASNFEFHEDGTFSMFFDRGYETRRPIFARLAFV